MDTIRIGTRASKLALTQANSISDLLKKSAGDINIEIVTISTKGDQDRVSSLASIGGTGVFTKRIETELLQKNIDIAVHSAKDLPSIMTDGLTIGAVPQREAVEDVLICREDSTLDNLPHGAIIGTGSPRRKALLLSNRPDLAVEEIRGNIETRLQKLEDGLYDALIMAAAGLNRLGLSDKTSQVMPADEFIPAPGQGSLIAQVRNDDHELIDLLKDINNDHAYRCLNAERMLLHELGAGCSAAVGGLASIVYDELVLNAVVLDKSGKVRLEAKGYSSDIASDEPVVSSVAEYLFKQGAKSLIG